MRVEDVPSTSCAWRPTEGCRAESGIGHARGGLAAFTRNVAHSHRHHWIQVNALNIGWKATPTEHRVQTRENQSGDWLEARDEVCHSVGSTAQGRGRSSSPCPQRRILHYYSGYGRPDAACSGNLHSRASLHGPNPPAARSGFWGPYGSQRTASAARAIETTPSNRNAPITLSGW